MSAREIEFMRCRHGGLQTGGLLAQFLVLRIRLRDPLDEFVCLHRVVLRVLHLVRECITRTAVDGIVDLVLLCIALQVAELILITPKLVLSLLPRLRRTVQKVPARLLDILTFYRLNNPVHGVQLRFQGAGLRTT